MTDPDLEYVPLLVRAVLGSAFLSAFATVVLRHRLPRLADVVLAASFVGTILSLAIGLEVPASRGGTTYLFVAAAFALVAHGALHHIRGHGHD